jgi:hypothetical protein
VKINTHDVVYTPFMNRVAAADPPRDADLVPSQPRTLARAVDDWCAMRGMAEYVIAQANSMLSASTPRVELDDEPYALAFVIRHGQHWIRLRLVREQDHGRLDLERSWSGQTPEVEPAEPIVLEEIVLTLLTPMSR